ncbi:MAG: hypothetical protein KDK36_07210, partial [Leptospiraceae bacterium]|nr:hypothetical protein [Leptospiraceae bacterium]
MKHFKFFFIILFLVTTQLNSEPTLLTQNMNGISPEIHYFCSSENSQIIYEVIHSEKFQPLPENKNSLGVLRGSCWFFINTLNSLDVPVDWIFQIFHPNYNFVDFYYITDNKIKKEFHIGSDLPFSLRPLPHKSFLFPVNSLSGEKGRVYIKVFYKEGGH